ncbi:hypothetical protein LEP1GSC047_0667 [Leptospira inadai serovar Lyme str. 10]|uniref:Uncharacterized protein n=1 Tax=Leptospira inadai serovar Lyme str. 10 TaxID=1049790 RepID=V6HDF4_9LEPT|nr:hypothetical protein LEP1GSC047_0667 [Leptospira inadai serovar Lyme str. 10]
MGNKTVAKRKIPGYKMPFFIFVNAFNFIFHPGEAPGVPLLNFVKLKNSIYSIVNSKRNLNQIPERGFTGFNQNRIRIAQHEKNILKNENQPMRLNYLYFGNIFLKKFGTP